MQPVPMLFDRRRLRKHRDRAAATYAQAGPILDEVAARAAESLDLLTAPLPRVAEIGGAVLADYFRRRPGTIRYLSGDLSEAMLRARGGAGLVMDEEVLPFSASSLDAIVSVLSLQWVNDLPGLLSQALAALRPDGLFLAVLPGAQTLQELRLVMLEAESARYGRAAARVMPMLQLQDAGALLQRTGFALPVVDSEMLQVSYPDFFALLRELKAAAAGHMLQQRVQHFTPRGLLHDAAARYQAQYADAEGRIQASLELVTLTAWKPAAGQQQAAARGSGKMSLSQALSLRD